MSQGRGAPKGNRNAAKAKIWSAAIERALSRCSSVDGRIMLDALAEKLIALAEAGDLAALREIGDRLEGRPAQALALEGSLELGIADTIRARLAARQQDAIRTPPASEAGSS